jgi:predicted CxxxxCH...CXXCH cytochrome family protein
VLRKAAPPIDLGGMTDVRYPGVGAHDRHLSASSRHAAVACEQCHVVPKTTAAPGHADSALPAELTFGALASQDKRPRYDGARHSCTNTYCHGADEPLWTKPREDSCGSCHGLPPPPPHAQSDECYSCHGEVIDAAGLFIAPEKHVNGTVETGQSCDSCHGSGDDGAPPPDLAGSVDIASIGVGAHAVHLAGGVVSRALTCGECHQVPSAIDAPGHLGALPAEVMFTGAATADDRAPSWDRTTRRCSDSWCHGPSASAASPVWTTSDGPLACQSCHGLPPAAPHPQEDNCVACHAAVVGPGRLIIDRTLHVNGIVDLTLPTACDSCHGSGPLGAPPPDLEGNTSWMASAVGAHATHLTGTIRSRAVACNECHLVPSSVAAPGHLDSALPAELTFSGVAIAFGATPSYDGQACANTYCHGGMFVAGNASGGTLTTPLWSAPPLSQIYCGSCHGLPPPAPHPNTAALCANCHPSIDANYNFPDPSLHVNGIVDLAPNP